MVLAYSRYAWKAKSFLIRNENAQDFLDLCPQLIRFLIGLNSSKHLEILLASVTTKDGNTTIDVTETMNKLKRRNCCILLLDFEDDLEISVNEGKLRLKAQFDGEETIDHVIPFDRNTEYLLCDGG